MSLEVAPTSTKASKAISMSYPTESDPTSAKAGKAMSLSFPSESDPTSAKAGKALSLQTVPTAEIRSSVMYLDSNTETAIVMDTRASKTTKPPESAPTSAKVGKVSSMSFPTESAPSTKAGKSMSLEAAPTSAKASKAISLASAKAAKGISMSYPTESDPTSAKAGKAISMSFPTETDPDSSKAGKAMSLQTVSAPKTRSSALYFESAVYVESAMEMDARASKSDKTSSPASAKTSKPTSAKTSKSMSLTAPLPSTSAMYTDSRSFKATRSYEVEEGDSAQMKSSTSNGTTATKSDKSTGSAKSSKSESGEYFLSPFSCPQHCITAENFDLSDHLLEDAVTTCDAANDYQAWRVHDDGTFLKFESAAQYDEGMCLSVMHSGPTDLCSGKLGLVRCTHSSTDWYFTGDQLLSATCWSKGFSVAMTVDEECSDLTVSSDLSAFMLISADFVSSIELTERRRI